MIRIVHYIGSLELGGSQAFVMELYRKMDRGRIQFDFVTFPGERGPLRDEIKVLGGRIFECPKYNGMNHFRFVRWWRDFLRGHPEYKVVHGHVRSVAAIYLPVARTSGRFAILHSHSASNGKGMRAAVKFLLQLPVRFQADYYMACSEAAGKWLFGECVMRGGRYKTVKNAIDAERFGYDPAKRRKIRNRYGLQGAIVIGHVGRFYEVKNQEFLLDVIREALKAKEDARLLLVGDGPMREAIENKARDMGVHDRIVFAGARTDAEDYYQAMDVFAFPSKWEGLGIAAIEAQCSGLGCVVSEGVPDVVDVGAGLVQRLSLGRGAAIWAEALLSWSKFCAEDARKGRITEAKAAGYDAYDSAKKMQGFYLKAARHAGSKNS